MVLLSGVLCKGNAQKTWIDSLRIFVKGGHGGNGLPTVGGIGGPGGNIYISPSKKVNSLLKVYSNHFAGKKRQRLIAGCGDNSSKSLVLGQQGEDITLQVPLGIQIFDDRQRLLKDLDTEDLTVRVAGGGNGGSVANGWMGQPGQARHIRLDLKIIADVGLVGFPNAGKSTLLKAISRAQPKIASYPFTTIKPNLGEVVYSKDMRKILLADLPGLIEGSSYNVGMGHRFLKHVERTRMLLIVLDVNGFELHKGSTYRSPFETLVLLNKELELYNPDLVEKPCIVVANKMDTPDAGEKLKELEGLLEDYESSIASRFDLGDECRPSRFLKLSGVIPISAKHSRQSVQALKEALRDKIDLFDDRLNTKLKTEDDIADAFKDSWTNPDLIIPTDVKLK